MLSDKEKEEAWSETEIRFRADLLILNSEFPTHRKTEAMEELLEIYNKQSKEIEELKEDSCCMTNCVKRDKEKIFLEDKIKAKIEELNNPESEFFKSLFSTNETTWIATIQRVLQSLLEKE